MMVTGSGMGANDDHVAVVRNVFTIEPFTAGQVGGIFSSNSEINYDLTNCDVSFPVSLYFVGGENCLFCCKFPL
jgi:hypothetical protein